MKIHADKPEDADAAGSRKNRQPNPSLNAIPTAGPHPIPQLPSTPGLKARVDRPDFEAFLRKLQRHELEVFQPKMPRSTQVTIHQEGGCFVLQPKGEPAYAVALARIRKIQATPPPRQNRDGSLFCPAGRLATGVYGQGVGLMYLLFGDGVDVELYAGVRADTPVNAAAASTTLRICLTANYNDVHLLPVASVADLRGMGERLESLRFAASMIGNPSPSVFADASACPMDKLIRALAGSRFALVIQADPVASSRVQAMARQVSQQIAEVHRHVRWSSSHAQTDVWQGHESHEETDYFAQQYEQLLHNLGIRLDAGLCEGLWRVSVTLLTESESSCRRSGSLLRALFGGADSRPEPIKVLFHASGSGVASQLAQLRPIATSSDGQGSPLVTDLSSSELGILTELPRREASGFGISRPRDFAVDVPVGTVQNVALGTTLCSGAREGSPLSIAVDDLTRHALIVGVTGSGKTTTALHLLNQLWTKHRVPFLVIEPAKSHYRQLLGLPGFEELQVFSPGCGELAPFRINPFAFPPGIHPQTHVSNLYSVFSAAFTLFSPMPYVLERSLCEVYEDRGWDLAGGEHPEVNPETGRPPALSFPTLSDLYDKISQVVNSLGYGERIRMDVTAALQARVDSLRVGQKGLTFDCRFSTPFSAILDRPTVLELSHVGSDEEKSFLMGLLLMRLYEIRESGGDVPHIQHVTLIEEAHRLLRRVSSDVGANSGNPRAQAVETFCNILAEIRAYGEGVIVADQIPTKLAPDVLKNTNLKILHRIVADDDREAMAGAMNLGRPQQRAVTSLSRGEAVVYAEGLDEPALIRVPPPLAHAAVSKQAVESTAAAFYRAHSECLAQFTGCTHCRNVCKHAARVKRSLRSESVFTAAWAVCVACVSDPKSITLTPEWLFAKLARKNLGILNESQSPDGLEWCFLTLVIEIAAWEVHQRFGRTLAQTARLATLMTQFFWAAYGSSHQDETPAAALRAEVLSLTNAIKGPYVGCDLCNRRCLYRGVAEMIARRPNSISRLHKAINATDSHAAVAALCHRWASVELPNGATTASNELALCVLINFLARTEIRDPVPFISLVFGMGSSPDLS